MKKRHIKKWLKKEAKKGILCSGGKLFYSNDSVIKSITEQFERKVPIKYASLDNSSLNMGYLPKLHGVEMYKISTKSHILALAALA